MPRVNKSGAAYAVIQQQKTFRQAATRLLLALMVSLVAIQSKAYAASETSSGSQPKQISTCTVYDWPLGTQWIHIAHGVAAGDTVVSSNPIAPVVNDTWGRTIDNVVALPGVVRVYQVDLQVYQSQPNPYLLNPAFVQVTTHYSPVPVDWEAGGPPDVESRIYNVNDGFWQEYDMAFEGQPANYIRLTFGRFVPETILAMRLIRICVGDTIPFVPTETPIPVTPTPSFTAVYCGTFVPSTVVFPDGTGVPVLPRYCFPTLPPTGTSTPTLTSTAPPLTNTPTPTNTPGGPTETITPTPMDTDVPDSTLAPVSSTLSSGLFSTIAPPSTCNDINNPCGVLPPVPNLPGFSLPSPAPITSVAIMPTQTMISPSTGGGGGGTPSGTSTGTPTIVGGENINSMNTVVAQYSGSLSTLAYQSTASFVIAGTPQSISGLTSTLSGSAGTFISYVKGIGLVAQNKVMQLLLFLLLLVVFVLIIEFLVFFVPLIIRVIDFILQLIQAFKPF